MLPLFGQIVEIEDASSVFLDIFILVSTLYNLCVSLLCSVMFDIQYFSLLSFLLSPISSFRYKTLEIPIYLKVLHGFLKNNFSSDEIVRLE